MSEAAMEALAQAAAAEAASGGGMGWAMVLLAATAMSTPVLALIRWVYGRIAARMAEHEARAVQCEERDAECQRALAAVRAEVAIVRQHMAWVVREVRSLGGDPGSHPAIGVDAGE
jgi:N-acyl-D-aspartate/D-glutamate deacylase